MEMVVGLIGAIGAMATALSVIYLARQTADSKKTSELSNRLALLAAHDRVTDLALSVDKLFIERPELRKYFYAGEDYHSADQRDQERITALAEYISDFIENAMVHEMFLEDLTIANWREYYVNVFRESPAVREFLQANGAWYDPGVTALLQEVDRESRRIASETLTHRELGEHEDLGLLAGLERLYLGSFPEYERAPFESIVVRRLGGRRVVVGQTEGTPAAAFAVLLPLQRHAHVWLLEYLAVTPRLRSTGVGKRMLEACRALAATAGCDQVLMEVEDPAAGRSSIDAQRRWDFYARNGVGPVPWIKDYWMPDLTHPDRRVPMKLLEMRTGHGPIECDARDLLEDLYRTAYGEDASARHLPQLIARMSTATAPGTTAFSSN